MNVTIASTVVEHRDVALRRRGEINYRDPEILGSPRRNIDSR